ncbi:MAG TPA: hypothetical protein PKV00_07495, partial [Thauera sp.]|nr:hypothetical protein [Thauera sp.]
MFEKLFYLNIVFAGDASFAPFRAWSGRSGNAGNPHVALSFFGKKVPSVTPVPEVERAPAAVELPPPTELSGLDFSATDHGRALGRAAGL